MRAFPRPRASQLTMTAPHRSPPSLSPALLAASLPGPSVCPWPPSLPTPASCLPLAARPCPFAMTPLPTLDICLPRCTCNVATQKFLEDGTATQSAHPARFSPDDQVQPPGTSPPPPHPMSLTAFVPAHAVLPPPSPRQEAIRPPAAQAGPEDRYLVNCSFHCHTQRPKTAHLPSRHHTFLRAERNRGRQCCSTFSQVSCCCSRRHTLLQPSRQLLVSPQPSTQSPSS